VLTANNPAEKPHAIHRNPSYGLTPVLKRGGFSAESNLWLTPFPFPILAG
jgi:hypothetical protein